MACVIFADVMASVLASATGRGCRAGEFAPLDPLAQYGATSPVDW